MKDLWNSFPPLVKNILRIIAILLGAFIIWQIYVFIKKWNTQRLLENSTVNTTIAGVPVSTNLGSVAQEIYAAFFQNDWFGITEDESAAVTAILNVPKPLIPQLSAVYFKAYTRNLNADFLKYAKTEYPRVSHLFN